MAWHAPMNGARNPGRACRQPCCYTPHIRRMVDNRTVSAGRIVRTSQGVDMPESSYSGIRIFLNTPRPTPAQVASFRDVPIGNICDAMDHLGAMNHRIKPLDPSSKMCGPALTVRVRPGDNLMVWKGVEIA